MNYPQGKLEIDAARALVRLGEKSDLERALKLYETARIWAIDAVTRSQIDQALDKIRTALTKPKPKPVVVKPVKPAPVTPAPVAPTPPVVNKAKSRSSSVGCSSAAASPQWAWAWPPGAPARRRSRARSGATAPTHLPEQDLR